MVHLARQGESHLVKLAVPIIAMLTDLCFSDKAAMTREEAESPESQQKIWRLLAGPKVGNTFFLVLVNTLPQIESMSNDPLLYPGKADEETLSKMPPTIVWEAEFDFFITEATR